MAFSSPSSCLSLTLVVLVAACGPRDHSALATSGGPPPPHAEFLVATQDSTFWITTKGTNVRARGAPLTLAQYDGRFFEIYLADDDRSYPDAQPALRTSFRRRRRRHSSIVESTS